jgi:heme/copper-type cytochrome/quinol oxidase subunit 4
MTHLSSRGAVLVWMFLAGATLGSAWLAEHHAFAGNLTAVFVMAVAFFKGRAIMLYFMELRGAPRSWRIAFELWALAATVAIAGLWAFTAYGGS